MVLSLRAFQTGYHGSTSARSGQISLGDTELSDRNHKSFGGATTPAPGGMFKLPLGILTKNGRKQNKNGEELKSSDNGGLDGVVVSVDRLEKTDGNLDSNASGRRNKNSDPEKGLIGGGVARPASLYSQGNKVSAGFLLEN